MKTEQETAPEEAIGMRKVRSEWGRWCESIPPHIWIFIGTTIALVAGGVLAYKSPRLLWAAACAAIGWAVGFLFGVPHTRQAEFGSGVQEGGKAQGFTGDNPFYQLRSNASLEDISGWLTKIIVGVGLTQITVIPTKLHEAAAYVAKAIGDPGDEPFALGIILFFFTIGFLGGYGLTRLYFLKALAHAEIRAQREIDTYERTRTDPTRIRASAAIAK
jgi:hypothetical protein